MAGELSEFVARALEKGIERGAIVTALEQAGWSRAEIDAAIGAFAAIDFPLAVPRPRPYLSAWEMFIYLILFVALYLSAFSLGDLVFAFIERAFPDPLERQGDTSLLQAIRTSLSVLVVAFPLFLFAFHHVTNAIARDPTKRGSQPRKWLTYGTLFIASVALICDVSTLVYNVLGGEFTVRFGLKVATVAILAGGIFGYFLVDMKRDEAV
jgi:hypothetical protein